MLSQYYNRHSSLSLPKKTQLTHNHQEDDIISSFYQERKSRTNQNAKQHNLLRKNISYFHNESTAPQEQNIESLIQHTLATKDTAPLNHQNILATSHSHLSRPPMPKASTTLTLTPTPTPVLQPQSRISQPTLKSPILQDTSLNNISQPSSNFSSINMKPQSEDQDYRKHLKSQLNKRINIKHYLTEISEQNKENHFSPIASNSHPLQLKYNYDVKVPHRQDKPNNINNEISRISYSNSRDSRVISEEKDNRFINESRVNNQVKSNNESQMINESRAIYESRHSINSILHDTQNAFQFSRNEVTDRTQNNKFRHQARNSLPTLGDSGRRSSQSQKKTEKQQAHLNILREEQLSDLQENSHPIRQNIQNHPTASRHNLKYFQPQVHAEYKRKIGDLQRQVQELRSQHKREDKFIQSILKMRRVMENTDEDCSLKELWRWIKHLPQRK